MGGFAAAAAACVGLNGLGLAVFFLLRHAGKCALPPRRVLAAAGTAAAAGAALGGGVALLGGALLADFIFGFFEAGCAALGSALFCWPLWLRPVDARRRRWAAVGCGAVLLAVWLLETFFFNYAVFAQRGNTPVPLALDSFTSESEDIFVDAEGIHVPPRAGGIAFEGLDLEVNNLSFTSSGSADVRSAQFFLMDDASSRSYVGAYDALFLPQGPEERTFVKLESHGELHAVMMAYTNHTQNEVVFHSLVLNDVRPYAFSALRCALLAGVLCLVVLIAALGWHRTALDTKRPAQWAAAGAITLACLALAVWTCQAATAGAPAKYTDYPHDEAVSSAKTRNDPYVKLFDALYKGQLWVDVEADPVLAGLDNPYDPTLRTAAGAEFLFDYAYYGGQYFVYFGPAPLVLVYVPFYLATGGLPSPFFASLVMAVLCIFLLWGALYFLFKTYCRKINLLLFISSYLGVLFGAGAYMLLSSGDHYHLVVLCAQAGFYALVACAFAALGARRTWARRVLFALAGLCVVWVAAARPNTLLLAAAFLAPALLGVLAEKARPLKARLWDAGAFLLPVAAGGALLMAYNALRFGSPFEFGSTYQLTLRDITPLRATLADLPAALYYFIGGMPSFVPYFPWVRPDYVFQNTTGNAVHGDAMYGLLALPLAWGLLCGPGRAQRSSPLLGKQRIPALMLWCTGIAGAGFVWISYVYGGTAMRYLCDILPAFLLLAALCLARRQQDMPDERAGLYARLATALCAATVFAGLAGIFSNNRDYILSLSPAVYQQLYQLFSLPGA